MLSSPRLIPILRIVIIVCAVGLVLIGGLFVRYVVSGGLANATPQTEIERGVFAAEEAVKANPKDATARIRLAAAYLERKSPRLALEQAQLAIRLAPKDPSAYYVMGLAQSDLGSNDLAIVSLEKASTMKGQQGPFYQDAYVALARAYEKAGNAKKAETAMTKAINYGPENALLLYERGQFYERQKNWRMALYDYGWALTYAPQYDVARERFDELAKAHPKELKAVKKGINEGTSGFTPAGQETTSTGK